MKTHCRNGHEYTATNTYLDTSGNRRCKICFAATKSRWYRNKGVPRQQDRKLARYATHKPPAQILPSCGDDFGRWLSGFTDGEGSFIAYVNKYGYLSLGFVIHLRADDTPLLDEISAILGVGTVAHKPVPKSNKLKANPSAIYVVKRTSDLYAIIVPFFEVYSLKSKKKKDFEIWKQIISIAASQPRGKGSILKDENRDRVMGLVSELKHAKTYK